MIDEKKLIEALLHNDGMNFSIKLHDFTPEGVGTFLQEYTDKMKQGFVNLINKQPKILFRDDWTQREESWIPVTDSLPDPFTVVFVYDSKDNRIADAYLTRCMEWVGVRMNHEVTHWMPIPEPPKGGEC